MSSPLFWRKVHYWSSLIVALPILLVIFTGLLLQVKKDFHWIQPAERRGSGAPPVGSFEEILARCAAIPGSKIAQWSDIDRIDYRPDRALLKVTSRDNLEIQLDPGTGEVLQVAFRRSDLIEALHDGAWFGAAVKRWVFLPAGLALLLLWATGVYLFLLPQLRRRRGVRPVRA